MAVRPRADWASTASAFAAACACANWPGGAIAVLLMSKVCRRLNSELRSYAFVVGIIAALLYALALGVYTRLIGLPGGHPETTGAAVGLSVIATMAGLAAFFSSRKQRAIRRLVVEEEGLLAKWVLSQEEQDACARRFNSEPGAKPATYWIGHSGIYCHSSMVHARQFHSWSPQRIRVFRLHTDQLPYRLEVQIAFPSAVFLISLFAAYSHGSGETVNVYVPGDFHHEPAAIAAALGVPLTFEPPRVPAGAEAAG